VYDDLSILYMELGALKGCVAKPQTLMLEEQALPYGGLNVHLGGAVPHTPPTHYMNLVAGMLEKPCASHLACLILKDRRNYGLEQCI